MMDDLDFEFNVEFQKLCILLKLYYMLRKEKRQQRRFAVRKLMQERRQKGFYNNLIPRMRISDVETFKNFHRMDPQSVEDLLALLGPHWRNSPARLSEAITQSERLAMTLSELPEPILTKDLVPHFEEVALYTNDQKQEEALQHLSDQLPICNKVLLAWILVHFNAVIQNETSNKMNIELLAMLLSPDLQMSHRLLVTLLYHYPNLFSNYKLIKYVPPITSSSPNLPEEAEDIQTELSKQESLLSQIHSEMNAGFVSKKREEQLWEVQRIITQLKRKLRSIEKWQEKSLLETTTKKKKTAVFPAPVGVADPSKKAMLSFEQHEFNDLDNATEIRTPTQTYIAIPNSQIPRKKGLESPTPDGIYIDRYNGLLMVPKMKEEYCTLLRLQFENQELLAWKTQLQARINTERAEVLQLKQAHRHQEANFKFHNENNICIADNQNVDDVNENYIRVIEHYICENTLLENKRFMLAKDIFDERCDCIGLQAELLFQKLENIF